MIHPNLAALAALAMADEDAASLSVKVTLSHASASLMRNPARQSNTTRARVLSPCGRSPATRITVTISSTDGGSAG
jgi:hypothetical protein